jgi:hypothetical protein
MRTIFGLVFVTSVALIGCSQGDGDDGWDFADGKGDGAGSISYGALAIAQVPTALTPVVQGLAVVDDDVMPPEVKDVRKKVAALRDQIDLFVYAYSDKHGDQWQDIRDELDTGYETLGGFKDLFDRQGVVDPADAVYDQDELEARRAEAVEWTTAFLDADHQADLRAYLSAPSQSKLYTRDRDDMSPYFWGATKIEPSLTRSGYKNMAKLTRELLELALDDYADVLDLRDIHKPSNQEKFHAFRKRIRSIARMPGYFPRIVEDGVDLTDALAVVAEAVDLYGALNDKISRYAADPDGDLEDEIRDDWRTLREWQRDHDFDRVLDDIHDAIRH